MRTRAVVVALLAFALFGCCSAPRSSKPALLDGTNAEVRERLLAEIPPGTSLTEAERIMKEHGLRCSVEMDKNKDVPYLSCGWSHKADFWVTWVWSIRIDCPNGVVTGIECKQYGIGP